jgi:hypothetical protein
MLPGGQRQIAGNYDASALDDAKPVVRVDGWNIEEPDPVN